jgi:hypothetical protein
VWRGTRWRSLDVRSHFRWRLEAIRSTPVKWAWSASERSGGRRDLRGEDRRGSDAIPLVMERFCVLEDGSLRVGHLP